MSSATLVKPTQSRKPKRAPETGSVGDLLRNLGGIPPRRVRLHPAPGTATEKDLLAINEHDGPICELVRGTLVEKPVGYQESMLAVLMAVMLQKHVEELDAGIVLGADGMLRLVPGLVRIPDVSFIAWERFPNRELPDVAIPSVTADLAVEILSRGNSRAEMALKRSEYFRAGTRLIWEVDPRLRQTTVYTAARSGTVVGETEWLSAAPVLPGLKLKMKTLFDKLPGHSAPGQAESKGRK